MTLKASFHNVSQKSILMHGVILLSDAISYDNKIPYCWEKNLVQTLSMPYLRKSTHTLRGGLRQYMWCPRSHWSHNNIFSGSPFLLHSLQRVCSTDLDQVTAFSSVDRCKKTCERLVLNIHDSSHRSSVVLWVWVTLVISGSSSGD